MLPMFGERRDRCSTQRTSSQEWNMEVGVYCYRGWFSAFGTGNLVRVKGLMKMEDYEKILKDNLRQSATKDGLGRCFDFQDDSIPNFWCRTTSKWAKRTSLTSLHKAQTWIQQKICGSHWRPESMPGDQQICRSLRDLLRKNGLRLLRRHAWTLLRTTTNN